MALRLALTQLAAGLIGTGQVITTVAGTSFVFPPTPLPATSAPLGFIPDVAVDAHGNVYVADASNNIVEKFTPLGQLTVVAGNGIPGFSGDGGPATSAALNSPQGVAVDSAGNLYIVDDGNVRLRKVSNGIITTIAGNGIPGFSGDGGPATSASLNFPYGVAFDPAGNIYIADTLNNRIRKVSNGVITTVAGSGATGFSGDGGPATGASLNDPQGLAVDSAGNLYIGDRQNFRIRKVFNGIITTVAGGGSAIEGPATSAVLDPAGLALDAAGNLYIADDLNLVRKLSNGMITTVAGNGAAGFSGDGGLATNASVSLGQYAGSGVAVDSAGNLYIADVGNNRVRKVSGGIITTVAGNGNYSFSGDGGPATSASLNFPEAVAIDSAGNLYIADKFLNRVRKVSKGIITTVAGNGSAAFSGDGGPATGASLNSPQGVAVDQAGNLYIADVGNQRIRKVSNGIITTVVGNGTTGFSGDGGPATSSSLFIFAGAGNGGRVAVDAAGNLYISDLENYRIRKVSNGIITTVAGNGAFGFSGDGGPATSASLSLAQGVAVDAAGNLFIADTLNNRIRKVSNGTITTFAGNGTVQFSGDGGPATSAGLAISQNGAGLAVDAAGSLYIADGGGRIRKVSNGIITTVAGGGFSGDGGLATSASLDIPLGVVVDSTGNIYIAETFGPRVREVLAIPPALSVTTTSLAFETPSGGAPTATQTVGVTTSIPSVQFSVAIMPSSAAQWLIPNYSSGATPLVLTFLADPTALAPGTYAATITINAPVASPATQSIAVTFVVGPGQPPTLKLDHDSVSFGFPKQGTARSQLVQVKNAGGGALSFAVATSTQSGGRWLSASPASGTATPGSPGLLTITADPSSLQTGTYQGMVTVTAGSQSQTVLVVASVSALNQAILLGQAGLSFLAVSDGGIVPPQSLGVYNVGTGVMSWTVTTSTVSGGAWLQATPNTGNSDASSSTIPRVTVTVNPAGLAPGRYYGLVQVSSAAAANSPQVVTATLEVLPAGQDPGAVVQPAQLNFPYLDTAGNGPPSSQTLTIYDLSAQSTSFLVQSVFPYSLAFSPVVSTVQPQVPAQVVVQPLFNPTATPQTTTVTIQFSDGTLRQVPLMFIGGSSSSGAEGVPRRQASSSGCTPQKLVPALSAIGELATHVNAGWPTALAVNVMDDCGQPHTTGTVIASFSNGDPPVPLQSSNDGNWEGTWQNSYGDTGQVTIMIAASDPSRNLSGSAQALASLIALQEPPVFAAAGVVSNADPVSNVPVGLGSIISIYGNQLAVSPASFISAPLPTMLGTTQVFIAGEFVPLYFASPTLINLQIPYDIQPDTIQQMVVQQGNTLSIPIQITVAQAQPASFLNSANGLGAALVFILRNGSGFVATPSAPVQAGDQLILYCSGLGSVGSFTAGQIAPLTTNYSTQNPVTVTIGGIAITPDFAGLAPGFVGLYQVNVRIPPSVPTGAAVPMTIQVLNLVSPAITIPIQ